MISEMIRKVAVWTMRPARMPTEGGPGRPLQLGLPCTACGLLSALLLCVDNYTACRFRG